jgi:subtilisin family serine protease
MGVGVAQGQEARIPNDPYFSRQISFEAPGGEVEFDIVSWRDTKRTLETHPPIDLNIARAWGITTGSRDVVVAIIDDGFFYNHEDLRDNIWQNPGETGLDAQGYPRESNGLDDDQNGYVDDVMGYDFMFDDPDPDPYVFDGMDQSRIALYEHSIPAMGIIGAKGNNGVGVAGVNWDVSMMLLKIGAQGVPRGWIESARVDRACEAIRYAADNGARVINWSGFVSDHRPGQIAKLREAIEYAGGKGALLVCAAGNTMKDLDDPANAIIPQAIESEYLLNVAEIDFSGSLDTLSGPDRVSGSTYGVRSVDIAAIARNYTTRAAHGHGVYGIAGGASNAAPVVSGVAALVLSVRPDLGALELKRVLLESARPLESLTGRIATGGIVDCEASVRLARSLPE